MPSRFPLTMTSADFCQYPMTSLFCHQFAASPLARNSANITDRSLRVRIYTFSSCGHCIYVAILRTVKGFCFFCNITHITPPNMQFLFVGPNLCRQLLSDSQSPATPLLLANTPYCKAYSGLAPYSLYPCLTHNRVGGEGLFPSPSSHTTVRAVRHTAVCQINGCCCFNRTVSVDCCTA